MLSRMSALLFLLVLACGGASTLPQAEHRVIVMQLGEVRVTEPIKSRAR